MAFTSDPNLLSTQEVMEAMDPEREQVTNKATTSTASLSSSTSKDGVSCSSRKAEGVSCSSRKAKGRKAGRKRKASARSSPYDEQAAVPAPSKPPPIVRRLSADKCHFKEIVHQFTGRPCPPPPPPACLPMLSPCNSNFLAAAISQSLKTLDTISAYLLLNGSSQDNNILLNEINKSKGLTFLQALKQQDSLQKSPMGTLNPISGMGTLNSSSTIGGFDLKTSCPSTSNFGGVDFKSLVASHLQNPPKDINMGILGGQELAPTNMHKSQQITELESVLLKDNTASDNFFSLAWVLLNQMASKVAPLAP